MYLARPIGPGDFLAEPPTIQHQVAPAKAAALQTIPHRVDAPRRTIDALP